MGQHCHFTFYAGIRLSRPDYTFMSSHNSIHPWFTRCRSCFRRTQLLQTQKSTPEKYDEFQLLSTGHWRWFFRASPPTAPTTTYFTSVSAVLEPQRCDEGARNGKYEFPPFDRTDGRCISLAVFIEGISTYFSYISLLRTNKSPSSREREKNSATGSRQHKTLFSARRTPLVGAKTI